jgi:hypothetical protein
VASVNSDQVIALAAVVSSGIVSLGSLGFSFWNSSTERQHRLQTLRLEQEERYRVGLYDKRLAVHQEAYRWLTQLIVTLRSVLRAEPEDANYAGLKRQLSSESVHARAWWDGNCLYLDESSRSSVVSFIESCAAIAHDEYTPEELDPIKLYLAALRATQEGIGMKHLDVKEPRPDES